MTMGICRTCKKAKGLESDSSGPIETDVVVVYHQNDSGNYCAGSGVSPSHILTKSEIEEMKKQGMIRG